MKNKDDQPILIPLLHPIPLSSPIVAISKELVTSVGLVFEPKWSLKLNSKAVVYVNINVLMVFLQNDPIFVSMNVVDPFFSYK